MIANNDLIWIAGAGALLYLVMNKSTSQDNLSYSGSSYAPTTSATTAKADDSSIPISSIKTKAQETRYSSGIKVASTETLKQIDAIAKKNTQPLSFPEYGIVTVGGLGYSTANPTAFVQSLSKTTTAAKSTTPVKTTSASKPLGSILPGNALTKALGITK